MYASPQGSHDPEGAGLVVFTGARHDSKQSDIKAAMQLLFYTLDQLTERSHTHSAEFRVLFSKLHL